MSRNLIALQNRFLGHGDTIYDRLANLHDKQGFVSDDDIATLAQEHNLPPASIRTTAKFYEELSQDKPAKHTVKVCNGEACYAAGAGKCESKLRDGAGEDVRVEHVTCIGYCGKGPNAMVDGAPVSLAQNGATDQVLEHVNSGKALDLDEPTNAIYKPQDNQPCVLMQHFDKDVVGIERAKEVGVYDALRKAVTELSPQQVIQQIKASQLRGRGGAGFPAGIKLQTVADSTAQDGTGRKFVVVNFDEGDAGSYIDKELVERDPHTQLEGILLAAYACGATEAFIYVRFEYPTSMRVLETALGEAIREGIVGPNIFGSDFGCVINLIKGQGAYICGEETSLLRSIEGVPAQVSFKPPFPAEKGLWDCPTAVNNVETLHNFPWIIQHGGEAYAKFGKGHERSRGTKMVSLNTRVKDPGVYEIEMGVTLRELIFDIAGGMEEGQTFKAVQVGGPLGGIFPENLLDTPLDFEHMAEQKGLLGHAGVVVYSEEDNLVELARNLMHFCAIESCGKCFPCRIGAVRGTELFDQMMTTGVTDARLQLLEELCETMKYGSLCALGGMIPTPIENLIEYFPQELQAYRNPKGETAGT